MPLSIQWDAKYSVHDEGIDSEHQKLFGLVNDVLAIEKPEQEPQRFKADVKELFHYMEFHFRHEEELMEKVQYPDRKAHLARHKAIIAMMNGLLHDCLSLPELAQKLRHFLIDWLLKHVAEDDTRMAGSIDRFSMAGAYV